MVLHWIFWKLLLWVSGKLEGKKKRAVNWDSFSKHVILLDKYNKVSWYTE